jgi:NADPH:quinone reductase-like Zn-dependent oxidoreductase
MAAVPLQAVLAIQSAVLSTYKVVTTCIARNFPFVKALGVAEAFDCNDPDCAKNIRECTDDKPTKVFNCISEGDSPKISSEAIISKIREISYLLVAEDGRTDLRTKVRHSALNKQSFPPLTQFADNSRLQSYGRGVRVDQQLGHVREAARISSS